MKKSMFALVAVLLFFTQNSNIQAEEVFRIQVGNDYNSYSIAELRQHVWQLERAVEQLQMRVFQLEARPGQPVQKQWTCRIQSFGKTHMATEDTKAKALAKVLKKCSESSHAIHCDDSDVKCDNE